MSPDRLKTDTRVGLLGVGLMGAAMAMSARPRHLGHRMRPQRTMLPTAEVILDLIEPLLIDWPRTLSGCR